MIKMGQLSTLLSVHYSMCSYLAAAEQVQWAPSLQGDWPAVSLTNQPNRTTGKREAITQNRTAILAPSPGSHQRGSRNTATINLYALIVAS